MNVLCVAWMERGRPSRLPKWPWMTRIEKWSPLFGVRIGDGSWVIGPHNNLLDASQTQKQSSCRGVLRVINAIIVDEDFDGGGGGGGTSMADLGLMGGNVGAIAASLGTLRENFRREYDAFWNDATSKERSTDGDT